MKMVNGLLHQLSNSCIRFEDERGFLEVLYEEAGVVLKRSFSKAGVFRGMHLQSSVASQKKLIRVVSGAVIDFVCKPQGAEPVLYFREISANDGWFEINADYAHGFYALQDTQFEYFCLGKYNEVCESSYSIFDILISEFGIGNVIASTKDLAAKKLNIYKVQQLL